MIMPPRLTPSRQRGKIAFVQEISILEIWIFLWCRHHGGNHMITIKETSQELPMLSSATLDCQVPMIVMNWGPQLSEMSICSQEVNKLEISEINKIFRYFQMCQNSNFWRLSKLWKVKKLSKIVNSLCVPPWSLGWLRWSSHERSIPVKRCAEWWDGQNLKKGSFEPPFKVFR